MSTFQAERESFFGDLYDIDRKSPFSVGAIDSLISAAIKDTYSGRARTGVDQRTLAFYQSFEQTVLFEDSSFLILNKPAGVVSHWAGTNPIGVLEIARYLRGEDVVLAHRLDVPTTGVLVLAKSREAFVGLAPQFAYKERSHMEKKYLALLEGEVTPFRPSYAEVPLVPDGTRMKVVKDGKRSSELQNSFTHFRPMVVLYQGDGSKRTLMDVQIFTGRTHQIRVVSAQHLGHPVVGDYLYDPNYDRLASRVMLHAYSLSFSHPATGERVTVKAPVPDDFLALIK